MEKQTDPMLDILLDEKAIEIIAMLIAKMESITFDEGRTCVFKTGWAKFLFDTCIERMLRNSDEKTFDIDEWFSSHIKHSRKIRRDIDHSLYRQPIDTDWLSALLELEIRFMRAGNLRGNLLKVLHNILYLEDSAQTKLSEYCKTERQYNFEGISKVSSSSARTKLLMPGIAPAPKPGSMEDLLASSSQKK